MITPLCVAAMEYCKANPVDPINTAVFEVSCGVGVVITEEQITEKVRAKPGLPPRTKKLEDFDHVLDEIKQYWAWLGC